MVFTQVLDGPDTRRMTNSVDGLCIRRMNSLIGHTIHVSLLKF